MGRAHVPTTQPREYATGVPQLIGVRLVGEYQIRDVQSAKDTESKRPRTLEKTRCPAVPSSHPSSSFLVYAPRTSDFEAEVRPRLEGVGAANNPFVALDA